MHISHFIDSFSKSFPSHTTSLPWQITSRAAELLFERIKQVSSDYHIRKGVAIHKDALVEEHVIFKGPLIISANCFIGAHAYLRGGVFLGDSVSIGPGCEVKSSFILPHSALAHFNFIGDSLIGSHVNFEAGSIICNHFNERTDKIIHVKHHNESIETGVTKFGALIGDHCKIGANAVLSPGTILKPGSIVKRLELISQT
ncbi:MAG TPA: DapH/DapD/GlmU-related protein [Ohtaekwangia sp.]|nr:DapH/DapD/GlmU-related protein [Ohtaekwangia sp.]